MSATVIDEKPGRAPVRSGVMRRILQGPHPEAVPALIARAGTVVGILDIVAGVFPRFRHSQMHRMAQVLPGSFGPFAAALSLSAGVLLLLLAHGLRRRNRRAWRAAVLLLAVGGVSELVYHHTIVGVLIAVTLLVPLWRYRDEFTALPDPRSRWRDTERGFSMALGRIGDPADDDCLIATAYKQGDEPGTYGDLKAILHFVPWGTDGLSLDLMRRDRSADPGMNELLIVAALQAAPKLGIKRISPNFAMFRSALARGEKIGAGPVLRVWRGLLVFLSRWFQIQSLYKFNAKFQPGWQPRYVVYAAARDLP